MYWQPLTDESVAFQITQNVLSSAHRFRVPIVTARRLDRGGREHCPERPRGHRGVGRPVQGAASADTGREPESRTGLEVDQARPTSEARLAVALL